MLFEHYSACPQQKLRECIHSVQTIVRQAACDPSFVQPVLQAWSDILQSPPANPQQTTSAIRHLPAQMYCSPSPMATSVAVQYTRLPIKYQYPVSAPCKYPAFYPPASSQLPANPQEFPPATATSLLPYSNPPFQSAAPLIYSPAVTHRASVAKPKKKIIFFQPIRSCH